MSETLAAAAGFAGAIVTLGIPLGKMFADTRRDARRAVMHLTGEGAYGHEGVIPRIDALEGALDREGIEVPDPEPEEG